MNVLELFAGIGGFGIGFERAGHTVVAQVEIDKQCRKLLASKFPRARQFLDVRTFGKEALESQQIDIICAGFPCQDLSIAGQRAGLAGQRSGLFYELIRITEEIQPAFVCWENVPGLLSSDQGRDFMRVLMAFHGIGYHGCTRVLDCQYLGLAQRRRRVFGVFARADIGVERCVQILALASGMSRHPAPRRQTQQEIAGTLGSRAEGGGRTTDLDQNGALIVGPELAKSINAGRDGYNDGSDQTYVIQERAVSENPNIGPDGIGIKSDGTSFTIEARPVPQAVCAFDGRSRGDDGCGYDRPPNVTGDQTSPVDTVKAPCVAYRTTGNCGVQTTGRKTGAINQGTDQCQQIVGSDMFVRRLTEIEVERLQGFPDNYTAGFSSSTRYRMLGNAVPPPMSHFIASRIPASP